MVMEAKPRTLEIMVISVEKLYVDRNPVRENAYVVVRAESLSCCTTRMAKEGESNNDSSSGTGFLSWNEKFLLDMPMHARSITFEVQCKASNGRVRLAGVARIAVSDFLGGTVPESCPQVLSYGLRDWEGRRNGVIHFSVRVKAPVEKEEDSCSEVKPENGMAMSSGGFEPQVMGFQVNDQKNPNGVVTGIPVWWCYPNNV